MLAFHIKLDKGRLIGRSNRLPAFVADLLCLLLNILVFLGIAHFCLLFDSFLPPSWAARILCSFYSGICANCADRKNFLETIRFFAENRSSPENLGAVFQSATLTRCGIHGRQSWAKIGDAVTARQKRIPNPAPLRSFHPHSKTPKSKQTNSLAFSEV